jgi:hypothetical protein
MAFEPAPRDRPDRVRYTVVAEAMAPDAWHITVRELPATWTVAFTPNDLDARSRERIALDLNCQPDDFDIRLMLVMQLAH